VIREFSAGGVCVRRMRGRGGGSTEYVAAIRVKGGKVLALPKGNIDPGETAADAARREVREEAGVDGELVEKLGDVKYWYVRRTGERVFKVVSFFLLRYRSGSVEDHDHEVDAAEWVPLEDAERLLQYKGEKQMAAAALTALADSR
jgi:8-oxo-dGTP pyrophosphatase MutT (NUDIX family)